MLRQLKGEDPKPDILLVLSLGNGFLSYLIKKLFHVPFIIYALGSDWYIAPGPEDPRTIVPSGH